MCVRVCVAQGGAQLCPHEGQGAHAQLCHGGCCHPGCTCKYGYALVAMEVIDLRENGIRKKRQRETARTRKAVCVCGLAPAHNWLLIVAAHLVPTHRLALVAAMPGMFMWCGCQNTTHRSIASGVGLKAPPLLWAGRAGNITRRGMFPFLHAGTCAAMPHSKNLARIRFPRSCTSVESSHLYDYGQN